MKFTTIDISISPESLIFASKDFLNEINDFYNLVQKENSLFQLFYSSEKNRWGNKFRLSNPYLKCIKTDSYISIECSYKKANNNLTNSYTITNINDKVNPNYISTAFLKSFFEYKISISNNDTIYTNEILTNNKYFDNIDLYKIYFKKTYNDSQLIYISKYKNDFNIYNDVLKDKTTFENFLINSSMDNNLYFTIDIFSYITLKNLFTSDFMKKYTCVLKKISIREIILPRTYNLYKKYTLVNNIKAKYDSSELLKTILYLCDEINCESDALLISFLFNLLNKNDKILFNNLKCSFKKNNYILNLTKNYGYASFNSIEELDLPVTERINSLYNLLTSNFIKSTNSNITSEVNYIYNNIGNNIKVEEEIKEKLFKLSIKNKKYKYLMLYKEKFGFTDKELKKINKNKFIKNYGLYNWNTINKNIEKLTLADKYQIEIDKEKKVNLKISIFKSCLGYLNTNFEDDFNKMLSENFVNLFSRYSSWNFCNNFEIKDFILYNTVYQDFINNIIKEFKLLRKNSICSKISTLIYINNVYGENKFFNDLFAAIEKDEELNIILNKIRINNIL